MEQDVKQLQEKVEKLEKIILSLYSNTTLPFDIGEAFKKRLQPVSGDSNSTATTSYIQSVNESGASTYSVAKPMAGFITIVINGNIRLVPYY